MTGLVLASASTEGGGFNPPGTEDFTFPAWLEFDLLGVHFEINRITGLMVFGVLMIMAFFLLAFRRPAVVPGRMQAAGEAVYGFVRNGIAREVIGPEGVRFAPYLTTLFMFVLVMNFYEIVPLAQFPVTSRIAYPAFLAIISLIIFIVVGVRRFGLTYFKNALFPPGVPPAMYLILTPIELFSTFLVRPFTLAVRLFANMFAGHLLLLVFFLGTEYLLTRDNFSIVFTPISLLMAVVLTFFELLVQVLQAYIFTILTAVYVSGSLAEEH